MQFGEFLRKCQAKAGAFMLAAEHAVNLAERFEDLWKVVRLDTDAGIGDRDGDRCPASKRANPDLTPFGREFDGVGQKVQQNLVQTPVVAMHKVDAIVKRDVNPDMRFGCLRLDASNAVNDD